MNTGIIGAMLYAPHVSSVVSDKVLKAIKQNKNIYDNLNIDRLRFLIIL
jgi:hypothetical protein